MLHVLATGELEGVLRPVLAALEGMQPVLEAPIAAQTALTGLDPFVYSLTIKDVCRDRR